MTLFHIVMHDSNRVSDTYCDIHDFDSHFIRQTAERVNNPVISRSKQISRRPFYHETIGLDKIIPPAE